MNENITAKKHLFADTIQDFVSKGKAYLGKDGLYYCSKCNALISHDMKNGSYMVGMCTACENVTETIKKEILEENQKILKFRQEDCFPGKRWQDCTFDNDNLSDRETTIKLKFNYLANFSTYKSKCKGLLLYGGVGTGKTFYAYCVINDLLAMGLESKDYKAKGYKAKVIKILSEYNAFAASKNKKGFIDDFLKYDIICIDDLGAERGNDAIIDFIYCLVDTLSEHKKIIICTTNLPYNTLSTNSTDKVSRIYSRIIELTIPLSINKTNKRADSVKNIFPVWDAKNTQLRQEGFFND